MKLVNTSPFHAIVQVADLLQQELAAVVIVKATFDLGPTGLLTPSAEMMPISPDPMETPYGSFHGELFFKKRGVDVCVLGTVRRTRPVTHARLRLHVGQRFVHELLVFGDRYWLPGVATKEPTPAEPAPFMTMALGYTQAFGGLTEFNGMEAAYPDNPVGRGYYATEAQAIKGKLPNVESGAGPYVRRWNDKPKVVGWGPYPSHWGLRASANVKVNPERYEVEHVAPGIFNHAHPDLVFDELAPGTPIAIEGLHDRPLQMAVPTPPARVEVQVGMQSREVPAPIDGVFLWLDAGKVVVTQRARFGYVFQPEQLRRATVSMQRGLG